MEKSDSNPKWVEYIQSRIARANQWREEMSAHQELATNHRYVRILGKSFRAISISNLNPCGRLIRKDNGKEVVGSQNIKNAIQSVYSAYSHNDKDDFRPGPSKTEHKIQAFLIRFALMNGQRFDGALQGFDDVLEELIFVTDELSTGKLRADIIALGRKGDRYFPVFIELKVERELKRLKEQLEGVRRLMSIAPAPFIAMLAAASGVPCEKISFEGHRLMIVWSSTKSGREDKRVDEARSDSRLPLLFAEYSQQGDAYTFNRN